MLELLITERVKKWGKAASILDFGDEPLWLSNPHGAIAVHLYKVNKEYWDFKKINFEYICAVDGAWSVGPFGPRGGIGGQVINRAGRVIYSFSGPMVVSNSLEAEIEAILHVIRMIVANKFRDSRIVICSDSTEALSQVRNGFPLYFSSVGWPRNLTTLINKRFHLDFVPRDINEVADSLAKSRLNKSHFFSKWA